jgi:hypothetical protein
VSGFPRRAPRFEPESVRVGFVVDKVTVTVCTDHLPSVHGKIGQILVDVSSGLSPTPNQETKREINELE